MNSVQRVCRGSFLDISTWQPLLSPLRLRMRLDRGELSGAVRPGAASPPRD